MRAQSIDLKVHVLRFPRDAELWHLVSDYLQLRKDVFLDQMGWDLFADGAAEFEQYDHFGTTYVIAVESATGQVVGGARLLRTDQASPSGSGRIVYTYMIRDAARGLLDNLPIDISRAEPPVERRTWELTRLVSRGTAHVAAAILMKVQSFLAEIGAERCLFLGPKAFMRMASRMGFDPVPLGAVVENRSGRYLAFSCEVKKDGRRASPGPMVDAVRALNIGLVRRLHLAEDETILGTTYEWSQTGKRVTIWHDSARKTATRVVEVPAL